LIRDLKALWRSVRIYRLNRSHQQSLRELYQPFVSEGSVVFDIGAHAGDRTACFKALGATVVSIEPQPWFARLLKLNHLLSSKVTVLRCVVSDTDGPKVLRVNSRNPTVSTLSDDFRAGGHRRWGRVARATMGSPHHRTGPSPVDALIARFGMPAFIKSTSRGLNSMCCRDCRARLLALSFEFTMIQPKLVVDCIERCATLGLSRFNVSLGESHQLTFEAWLDAAALIEYLSTLPPEANSGDVYARREV